MHLIVAAPQMQSAGEFHPDPVIRTEILGKLANALVLWRDCQCPGDVAAGAGKLTLLCVSKGKVIKCQGIIRF